MQALHLSYADTLIAKSFNYSWIRLFDPFIDTLM